MFNHPTRESRISIVDMDKTIIGRIGKKAITETICNYQSDIPEQELTAKKISVISSQLRGMIQMQ